MSINSLEILNARFGYILSHNRFEYNQVKIKTFIPINNT